MQKSGCATSAFDWCKLYWDFCDSFRFPEATLWLYFLAIFSPSTAILYFTFTLNWSGWRSASLTRLLQLGRFIILRYLALKILCRDFSTELDLLSIYPKYIKCLCLKEATGRAGSILSTLNWDCSNCPHWQSGERIVQPRGTESEAKEVKIRQEHCFPRVLASQLALPLN